MSRAGDVWNSSAMESYFSSLKIERVHRRVYATRVKPRPMRSITSSGSTIRDDGTRRSAT